MEKGPKRALCWEVVLFLEGPFIGGSNNTVVSCSSIVFIIIVIVVVADVNECDQDDNVCDDEHGNCTNTHGSFNCACNNGFTGDGFRCTGAYGNQRPKLAVSQYITA